MNRPAPCKSGKERGTPPPKQNRLGWGTRKERGTPAPKQNRLGWGTRKERGTLDKDNCRSPFDSAFVAALLRLRSGQALGFASG